MCAEEIIPSVAINQVSGFAVDGDVFFLVTLNALACLRVDLNESDESEVCAIGHPQPARSGVEQQSGVDGIVVLKVGRANHLDRLRKLEVGGFGVEGLVPHGIDDTTVTASKTASRGTIYNKVSVAYLDCIGGCTATRSLCPTHPSPSVLGAKSTASGAEGIGLPVTFGNRRRVVNPWLTNLRLCHSSGKRHGCHYCYCLASHLTLIFFTGLPFSSINLTQKSLIPGPLITAPRRMFTPFFSVMRCDIQSSATIRRSPERMRVSSPLSHHIEAELEPTERRTPWMSSSHSITVVARKT